MSPSKRHLFQLGLLLLSLIMGSSTLAAAPTIAIKGCKPKCGAVQIPYPFGIGKSCYKNDWFEIVCRKTSRGYVPFLNGIKKEVVNITFGYTAEYTFQSIRIRAGPILSSGCSRPRKGDMLPFNLTGSPFSLTPNYMVAFGCNAKVSLINTESIESSCKSTCNITKYKNKNINEYCDGYRCCMVDELPQQLLDAKLESEDPKGIQDKCKFAFLTDEVWSPSNLSETRVLRQEYMPVTLYWFHDVNITDGNRTTCLDTKLIDGTTGYRCYCRGYQEDASNFEYGYRGNPYLRNGCEDINECEEAEKRGHKLCGENSKCVNTIGSYDCKSKKVWPLILETSLPGGLSFLVVGIWWLCRFIKKQKIIKQKRKFFKRNGGLLLEQKLYSTDGAVEKTKIFGSKEIEKATDKFSHDRILGQGGQGTVYKGMLVDGTIVAIKKSKIVDEENLEEFINEIVILTQVNHRNIVKLLGCCLEAEVPILVYEFIPNGNLFQHLHAQFEEFPLTWEARLQIAMEIANALYYLHSEAAIPIYHRDVKSTNILLDEKYRAKVSDFGTSRSVTIDQTHLTTIISGTVGYIDPEYFQSSQFTDKSDVYSFGVVLAELLTGEQPVSNLRPEEARILSTHFILAMEEKRLFDILDDQISEHSKYEEVNIIANLARRCLSFQGKKRPTMKEVVMELDRLQPRVSSENQTDKNKGVVKDSKINVEDSWGACTTPVLSGCTSSLSDVEPLVPHQTFLSHV